MADGLNPFTISHIPRKTSFMMIGRTKINANPIGITANCDNRLLINIIYGRNQSVAGDDGGFFGGP